MKVLDIVLLVILFIILVSGGYILWQNLPTNSIEFEDYVLDKYPDISSKSLQFYPNMRFKDSQISYFIDSRCNAGREQNILKALEILSQNTVLSFYSGGSNAELSFICSEIAPEPSQEGHFVAGEGGPTEIVNTTLYSVILHSKVSLYRSEKCSEPKVAIHETLHALGFDHNSNKNSILYPVTECNQVLDQYIIDEINFLYSIEALPDLAIEKISANQSGRYINFEIIVGNYGLEDSENAILTLYADDEKIKEFSLNQVDIGIRKSLSVQNIKGPTNIDKLIFVIESKESEELLTSNNRVEILVKS